jgi:dipeptidyl aminopeptidase/acylaminoacyl peptidase
MEADGTNQTRLTNNAVWGTNPSWSPDGTKIIFVSEKDGVNWIYMMEADGTNQTPLASFEGRSWLALSPDGTRIAFPYELPGIGFEIYLMDIDGSNFTRLTYDISGMICCPEWSPDGSKIAIADAYFPFAGDIYLINPDGTGLMILPNSPYPVYDIYPAWSPDGTKIAFQSSSGGDFDIYVMNVDGSGRKNLTNNSAKDTDADWQPLSFIDIDIKTDSYPNSINLKSKGVVSVAILTTDDFDATSVDPTSVIFAWANPLRWATEDFDFDGDIDYVFFFKVQELNLDENSTEAMLEGQTFSGLGFWGIDTVKVK